ncbi:MAG: polysaccharide deacetylase family protein [Phaeodactylibacter sp.]|nr:polysaccharide deacetylase family protein [Phaeodactylibacter sp.]
MDRYALWTNDVETTSIWFNTLRDETGRKVWQEGMPALLDIYEKYQAKTTFFFTGYFASLFPQAVKMARQYGHEVGSHSFSHKKEHGLDVLPYKEQLAQLQDSKKILEDISGEEVISFRSPALRLSPNTARALIESGYRIDSSVASQRFDMFLSFGGRKKLRWLTAPRLPYRVDEGNIFKKGDSPLVEVPLSATLFPYVSTTMRIFPAITRLQRQLLHRENGWNHKPIVFDIHPNEFIDESGEKRVIERRNSNLISYYMKDVIRSKLKVKNLGPAAAPLYEEEIGFYASRGYTTLTLKDYCQKMGLLKNPQKISCLR